MSRKLRFRALIGLVCVVAIAVGVLVYPPPEQALAVDAAVQLNLNWNGFTPSNCLALATLVNGAGQSIGASLSLTPNAAFSTWTGTFVNIPPEAVSIKFGWVVGLGDEESWVDTDAWVAAPVIVKAIAQPTTVANAQAD